MTSFLSREAAQRLRPAGAFHLPPNAQPIGSVVELVVKGASSQPEIVFTDTRRDMSWRVAMSPKGDVWAADVMMPMEPTVLRYQFEFENGSEEPVRIASEELFRRCRIAPHLRWILMDGTEVEVEDEEEPVGEEPDDALEGASEVTKVPLDRERKQRIIQPVERTVHCHGSYVPINDRSQRRNTDLHGLVHTDEQLEHYRDAQYLQ